MADLYLQHKSALNSTACPDNPIFSYGERMDRIQESEVLMRVLVGMQIIWDVFLSVSVIADYYFYRLAINSNHCASSSQSSLKYKQDSIMQFVVFVQFLYNSIFCHIMYESTRQVIQQEQSFCRGTRRRSIPSLFGF
jgi:hypothetical protein